MLTTTAFTDLRNFIKKRIWKAQYKISGSWYDATISEVEVTSAGIVRVKVPIAFGSSCVITGARLISFTNEVWATKTISVTISDAQTNLLVWFDFEITETES